MRGEGKGMFLQTSPLRVAGKSLPCNFGAEPPLILFHASSDERRQETNLSHRRLGLHVPGLLRHDAPASLELEGRAHGRHAGLRPHAPESHPRARARVRRHRLRPPRTHVPPRDIPRLQGEPRRGARRPGRADPLHAPRGRGAAGSASRPDRSRGGRHHRHAGRARRSGGLRGRPGDGGQGFRPTCL